uniref:ectonucleoside triphosphate diphosphohydrolase 2 n=1 Tax=Euleptes europaea TaxID=460621 RepID=UPI0025419917|nr:ectonucleoside triphosphate diphosphohydrolase 2 [Euleptes europaea]
MAGGAGKRVAAVLGVVCLAAVGGLVLLCLPARDLREEPAFKYGIVLDAGSSHTAMFVYKWPAGKENNTGIVSEHSMCDVEGGGISSYAADPPGAGRSLKACLNQAVKDVPKERHAVTPLYLGATAGMRLLNLTDPQASDSVLGAVASTLKEFPFDFRGAKILSGEDEGVFGWVTTNYLLENFIKYGWIGQWVRPKKKTLGAMDLGGASTQITFETQEVIESPLSAMTLQLYGQTYKVYTHSFLCYGRDQVLKRLLSKVLKEERFALKVDNPCWPRDYKKNFTIETIYDSPCTSAEKPTNYFPKANVNMRGSGDPALCRQRMESLFRFTSCTYSRCSFDGIFQPSVTGNFIAFSAFFYTVDFMQSVMKRRIDKPGDLEDAVVEICNSSWSELLQKAPDLEKRLPDYCPTAVFIQLLIMEGYRFDELTFPNIAFQKKAGDTSIGWALGYMLNLTNMIPAEETSFWKGTTYSSWVGLILLFVAIILVILGTMFCLLRSSKGRATI